MSETRGARIVGPNEGTAHSVVGDRYICKVSGEDTDGRYAAFDFLIPPGNGTPPHIHHREDEGFHILEGELTFYVGAERRRVVARPGDYVHGARGVPHYFRNEGEVPVRAFCIVAPAGLERFFAEVGVPLASPLSPPVPPPADEPRRMLEAAARYGLEILGPPPWLAAAPGR